MEWGKGGKADGRFLQRSPPCCTSSEPSAWARCRNWTASWWCKRVAWRAAPAPLKASELLWKLSLPRDELFLRCWHANSDCCANVLPLSTYTQTTVHGRETSLYVWVKFSFHFLLLLILSFNLFSFNKRLVFTLVPYVKATDTSRGNIRKLLFYIVGIKVRIEHICSHLFVLLIPSCNRLQDCKAICSSGHVSAWFMPYCCSLLTSLLEMKP